MSEKSTQESVSDICLLKAGSDGSDTSTHKHHLHQKQLNGKPLIQNSSLWINSSESDPMGSRFQIASTQFLDEISDRSVCKNCQKSRKYYCYSCHQPLDVIIGRVPKVRLPVKVDVIKHMQEVDGKSTSIHAAILAPEDCRIYTYPDIPEWSDQRVVLVFPGPNAQTIKQLIDDYYSEEQTQQKCDNISSDCVKRGLPFDRVVFIDSTWRQTKRILSDHRISRLTADKTVILSTHDSLFWRHQRHTPLTYLSTIEAIYYFFVDLHKILDEKHNNRTENGGQYDNRYDNLLFFFKHTYNKLRLKYNI